MSGNRSRTNSHTEVRVVPMRCTNFAKRYDFTAFQVGMNGVGNQSDCIFKGLIIVCFASLKKRLTDKIFGCFFFSFVISSRICSIIFWLN